LHFWWIQHIFVWLVVAAFLVTIMWHASDRNSHRKLDKAGHFVRGMVLGVPAIFANWWFVLGLTYGRRSLFAAMFWHYDDGALIEHAFDMAIAFIMSMLVSGISGA
jgi:hypothetical protein